MIFNAENVTLHRLDNSHSQAIKIGIVPLDDQTLEIKGYNKEIQPIKVLYDELNNRTIVYFDGNYRGNGAYNEGVVYKSTITGNIETVVFLQGDQRHFFS